MPAGPRARAAAAIAMHLSIVIPAYNEEKLLPGTLTAVAEAAGALTAAGVTHEVIVCDNNSSDRTAAIARGHGAAVIFEPVNQISRARNTGASLATGDWILFLDADSRPSYGLFSELAATLHDDTVLYGGCVMELDDVPPAAHVIIAVWHLLAKAGRYAAGSFLFVRRGAFLESGGFSAELFASEEIEFSRRLRALAAKLGQRFAFLASCPLVTSGRKLRFYSCWWHLRFILRTALCGTRNLRRREGCGLWYDGKR
jgi:glycosyltransferase involved in cell wall biosynthesis